MGKNIDKAKDHNMKTPCFSVHNGWDFCVRNNININNNEYDFFHAWMMVLVKLKIIT